MPTSYVQRYIAGILQRHPARGPVIDLCCGTYSDWYRSQFKGLEYKTLDFKAVPNYKYDYIADVCAMPTVPSEGFATALLLESLEHIYNPLYAFKEIFRILKSKGLFICSTVACWPIHNHPKDYFRFLPDGLEYLCSFAGFKIIDITLDPKDATKQSHCSCTAYKP